MFCVKCSFRCLRCKIVQSPALTCRSQTSWNDRSTWNLHKNNALPTNAWSCCIISECRSNAQSYLMHHWCLIPYYKRRLAKISQHFRTDINSTRTALIVREILNREWAVLLPNMGSMQYCHSMLQWDNILHSDAGLIAFKHRFTCPTRSINKKRPSLIINRGHYQVRWRSRCSHIECRNGFYRFASSFAKLGCSLIQLFPFLVLLELPASL
jgi:hypothetical protein